MAQRYLWNISKEADPVIQGQAGKPFYHEKGPKLKFENEQQPVDNKCLCKYPYKRYFRIYAKVDKTAQNVTVFKPEFTEEASQQSWWPDYAVDHVSGWQWNLCSGYVYEGCSGSSPETGKWQPAAVFPYARQCPAQGEQNDPQVPFSNLTFPAPSYIGDKDSSYTDPVTQTQLQTPFRTDTGAPSLMSMLVSSYRCCNGTTGCGTIFDESQDPVVCPSPAVYYCEAWFNVSWIQSPAGNVQQYEWVSMPIDPVCSQCRHEQKTIITGCTTARIRRYRERVYDLQNPQNNESCEECLKQLRQEILYERPPQPDCRTYRLYEYPQTLNEAGECLWGPPVIVDTEQAWSQVPVEIKGKGEGCHPQGTHTLQYQVYCDRSNYKARVYQWSEASDCAQQPEAPVEGPEGQPVKGFECSCSLYTPQGFFRDPSQLSDSRDSLDAPCNLPDPPPYKYKQLDQTKPCYEFRHTLFDVYRLPLTPYGQSDSLNADTCVSHYTYPKDAQGNPLWEKTLSSVTDYEVFEAGLVECLQTAVCKKDGQAGHYRIVRAGCPADSGNDRDSLGQLIQDPESGCPVYFALYWNPQEHCTQGEAQPASYNGCSRWERLGPMSKSYLAGHYIFPQMWTPYNFGTQEEPVWGFRYVAQAPAYTFSYCGQIPALDLPLKSLALTVQEWEPDCDECKQSSGTKAPSLWNLVQHLTPVAQCSDQDICSYSLQEALCQGYDVIYDKDYSCPQSVEQAAQYKVLCTGFPVDPGFYVQAVSCPGQDTRYRKLQEDQSCSMEVLPDASQDRCLVLALHESHLVLTETDSINNESIPVFELQNTVPVLFSSLYNTIVHPISYRGVTYRASVRTLPDAAQVQELYGQCSVKFPQGCCADYHYYKYTAPTAGFTSCSAFDSDSGTWEALGKLSQRELMQNHIAAQQWLPYAEDGTTGAYYIVKSPVCLEEMPAAPSMDVSGLTGVASYRVGPWEPVCNSDSLAGTNNPLLSADVLLRTGIPDGQGIGLAFQLTGMFGQILQDGGLQAVVPCNYNLGLPYTTGGFFGYCYDEETPYTPITQGCGTSMAYPYCAVDYLQSIVRYWKNPQSRISYNSAPVYLSGETWELPSQNMTVPLVCSFAGAGNEIYMDTIEVDFCGKTATFAVKVFPATKDFSSVIDAGCSFTFDPGCCTRYSYFGYVLEKSRFKGLSCEGLTPCDALEWPSYQLSNLCPYSWTFLGRFSQAQFAQKWITTDQWIPFNNGKLAPTDMTGRFSIYIVKVQTEQEDTFCLPPPENPFSVVYGGSVWTYMFESWYQVCQNGTRSTRKPETWIKKLQENASSQYNHLCWRDSLGTWLRVIMGGVDPALQGDDSPGAAGSCGPLYKYPPGLSPGSFWGSYTDPQYPAVTHWLELGSQCPVSAPHPYCTVGYYGTPAYGIRIIPQWMTDAEDKWQFSGRYQTYSGNGTEMSLPVYYNFGGSIQGLRSYQVGGGTVYVLVVRFPQQVDVSSQLQTCQVDIDRKCTPKAYTIFYVSATWGDKSNPEQQYCDVDCSQGWQEAGPFQIAVSESDALETGAPVYQDQNGNVTGLVYGWRTDIDPDTGFGEAVGTNEQGQVVAPVCGTIYWMHPVVHCPGEEAVLPSDVTCPSAHINWDVCGCAMKVMTVGPFNTAFSYDTQNQGGSLCDGYQVPGCFLKLYQDKTWEQLRGMASFAQYTYKCQDGVPCPADQMPFNYCYLGSGAGYKYKAQAAAGEMNQYGLYTVGAYPVSSYISQYAYQMYWRFCQKQGVQNIYVQLAKCHDVCQTPPTDDQMFMDSFPLYSNPVNTPYKGQEFPFAYVRPGNGACDAQYEPCDIIKLVMANWTAKNGRFQFEWELTSWSHISRSCSSYTTQGKDPDTGQLYDPYTDCYAEYISQGPAQGVAPLISQQWNWTINPTGTEDKVAMCYGGIYGGSQCTCPITQFPGSLDCWDSGSYVSFGISAHPHINSKDCQWTARAYKGYQTSFYKPVTPVLTKISDKSVRITFDLSDWNFEQETTVNSPDYEDQYQKVYGQVSYSYTKFSAAGHVTITATID